MLAALAGLLFLSAALGLLYLEWLRVLDSAVGGSVVLCGGARPVVAVPAVDGLEVSVYCLGPGGSSPAAVVNQSLYACPQGAREALVSVAAPLGWPRVEVRLGLCSPRAS